ncbi:MAG TPA: response regulator [Chloroflexota bacterium]|nr:response regulator [Chloroflexota bacterium]
MVAVELPAEITASFVAEARSYLPLIETSLSDLSNAAALSEAYRFAHTIKSSAAMMGHLGLSQLAELLEADLECVLLGEPATRAQAAQLTRSVGRIGRLLEGVTGVEVDVDLVLAEEVEDRMALDAPAEECALEPVTALPREPIAIAEPVVVEETWVEPEPEPESEPEVALEADVELEPEREAAGEDAARHFRRSEESVAQADPQDERILRSAEDDSGAVQAADDFTPLIDSLAEAVLAFGREVASGAPNPVAHRDAIAAWLNDFESQTGLRPQPAPQPAPQPEAPREPTPWERETRERREALLRAAIEAELRLQIEHEVRERLTAELPQPSSPFVAITARRAKGQSARPAASVATPASDSGLADDAEMREVFALEANEHLKRIDADVAALRREPADVERLRSLRRAVHTLKGAAAMMGFGAVAELSHSLEDRLDEATADGKGFDSDALARLFEDLDRLEGLVSGNAPVRGALVQSEPSEGSVGGAADERFHRSAQDDGVAPVAVPIRLERLDQLLTLAGETSVSISRWPEILSGAQAALAELRRTGARIESLLTALQSERHRRLEEDGRLAALSPQQIAARQGDFDALELDRYTPTDYVAHELAQIAAEASAAERELTSGIESAAELAEQQRRQTAELQDRLLDVRLVPLDELAARLERAAHGVALRRGKQVEVVFEGTSVAVDRAVLDSVSDALQHLVRNAVDHGIEVPTERRVRGKATTGTISVSARQTQGEVVIEVGDDGAGIDVERVRAAARAGGQVDLAHNDPRKAIELIFAPGVTTATAVDDVSGRGVGLDAVAEALSRIKGSVEVASEPGSGTIFQLRFPVTLAQARVLMAEVAGNPVALPAASVKHVTRLGDASLETTPQGRAVRLNGQLFPVGSLAGALGWRDTNVSSDPPLVLIESAGRRAAWTADAIGTHADVVVKSLGSHLNAPRGVAGASLLQDGRVALLLHLPDLLERDENTRRPAFSRPAPRTEESAALRVLVVDDSPTIRKLLVRMLRDLGWQPREAKDGAEALEAIRVDRPDVVLADIEMPRLDGYGLLTALRSQPATAELPVLMLTSRTAERHRTRAMELGANGYLTKPYRPEDVAAALRSARSTSRVN